MIVLGGDLASGADVLSPFISEQISRHCLPQLISNLAIEPSSLGQDSALKGVAALTFQKALEFPDLLKRMSGPILLESPDALCSYGELA